jgi:hypothetical protein
MFNPFKTRSRTIGGTYFGSHPNYPKTADHLVLFASDRGIKIGNGLKTWGNLTWAEITSFDYVGSIADGSFTATLATRSGNLTLEVTSMHASKNAGDNQMYASMKQRKLGKFKRFVVEHKISL